MGGGEHFLRIPPFPGSRAGVLCVAEAARVPAPGEVAALAGALVALRVGGAFWGARPRLPRGRDVLLAPGSAREARALQDAAAAEGLAGRAVLVGRFAARHGIARAAGVYDPWCLAEQAAEVRGRGQDLARVWGLLRGEAPVADLLSALGYRCPFNGAVISAADAAGLLGEWRRLIRANRAVAAVYGVARWKRRTVDALLWDGTGPVRHGAAARAGERALVWAARVPAGLVADLRGRGVAVGEIEDGMIRSSGLGADCVPPLSVVVDALGAHVDPARESELEALLARGQIAPGLVVRAAALRETLVAGGIGKYGRSDVAVAAVAAARARRRVLVVGQVADDRAVLLGGAGCTNRELLARARALEPDAELIYKPHPDVEAGHRRGAIPDAQVAALGARVAPGGIAGLLAEVDGVHVISSLAGFEALLRGLAVTVHGVPFYAGWGLTRDLAPVPARRGRARSLDELVAAAVLIYPRYLDPVTRLPCPAEVLVARIAGGEAGVGSALVWLRRGLGWLRKRIGRRFTSR